MCASCEVMTTPVFLDHSLTPRLPSLLRSLPHTNLARLSSFDTRRQPHSSAPLAPIFAPPSTDALATTPPSVHATGAPGDVQHPRSAGRFCTNGPPWRAIPHARHAHADRRANPARHTDTSHNNCVANRGLRCGARRRRGVRHDRAVRGRRRRPRRRPPRRGRDASTRAMPRGLPAAGVVRERVANGGLGRGDGARLRLRRCRHYLCGDGRLCCGAPSGQCVRAARRMHARLRRSGALRLHLLGCLRALRVRRRCAPILRRRHASRPRICAACRHGAGRRGWGGCRACGLHRGAGRAVWCASQRRGRLRVQRRLPYHALPRIQRNRPFRRPGPVWIATFVHAVPAVPDVRGGVWYHRARPGGNPGGHRVRPVQQAIRGALHRERQLEPRERRSPVHHDVHPRRTMRGAMCPENSAGLCVHGLLPVPHMPLVTLL